MNFGVNDIARKVKDVEFGVNEIARKVKKGYIGVNGVAQQFYSAERLIPFTSNPVPTTWEDSSDYLSATATNEYGEWYISADAIFDNSNPVSYAFDGDSDTRCRLNTPNDDTTPTNVILRCPENISINPTQIKITHTLVGNSSESGKVQGLTAEGEWIDLVSTLYSSFGENTDTANINDVIYYKAFRIVCYRGLSSFTSSITEFEIQSGTLKIE